MKPIRRKIKFNHIRDRNFRGRQKRRSRNTTKHRITMRQKSCVAGSCATDVQKDLENNLATSPSGRKEQKEQTDKQGRF